MTRSQLRKLMVWALISCRSSRSTSPVMNIPASTGCTRVSNRNAVITQRSTISGHRRTFRTAGVPPARRRGDERAAAPGSKESAGRTSGVWLMGNSSNVVDILDGDRGDSSGT